jgi:hypothetical protein
VAAVLTHRHPTSIPAWRAPGWSKAADDIELLNIAFSLQTEGPHFEVHATVYFDFNDDNDDKGAEPDE